MTVILSVKNLILVFFQEILRNSYFGNSKPNSSKTIHYLKILIRVIIVFFSKEFYEEAENYMHLTIINDLFFFTYLYYGVVPISWERAIFVNFFIYFRYNLYYNIQLVGNYGDDN